jgi:hypothetical protein
MRHLRSHRAIGAALAAMVLVACGATGQSASSQSPAAETPSLAPTPGASPSPSTSPTPAEADLRLVIADYIHLEVRLARLDATRTATVKGQYDGIVGGNVIVLNGTTLELLSRNGTVKKLGVLAAKPDWVGVGTVVVNPQMSQWMYATHNDASTATIHLSSATSDRVVATLPSPNGNAYYQPYAWNSSGVYMVRQPIGIGGAGPFLEYDFPLAKFDLTSGHVTDLSPQCIVHGVLDDGTVICGQPSVGGEIEIRSPSGQSHVIKLATGGGPSDGPYVRVYVSPDHTRLIAGRNGAKDPVINYQMAIADLTSSSAHAFGPLDYLPEAWLPDGRLVAEHQCAYSGWGGGPCDAKLDGTYIFSANGTTHSFFFKLAVDAVVVGYV